MKQHNVALFECYYLGIQLDKIVGDNRKATLSVNCENQQVHHPVFLRISIFMGISILHQHLYEIQILSSYC